MLELAAAAADTILPASAYGNGFDIEVAYFDGDGFNDLFFCNQASTTEFRRALGRWWPTEALAAAPGGRLERR